MNYSGHSNGFFNATSSHASTNSFKPTYSSKKHLTLFDFLQLFSFLTTPNLHSSIQIPAPSPATPSFLTSSVSTIMYKPDMNNATVHELIKQVLWEDIQPSSGDWFFIASSIIVFIIGLLGNILVCVVVWRERWMKTVTNLFIFNLSVADCMVLLLCMPSSVIVDVTGTWFVGSFMCKLIVYLQIVSVSVSVMTLTAISSERYFAICHPLKFPSTFRRTRLTITCIWLISSILAAPEFQAVDVHEAYNFTIIRTTCLSVSSSSYRIIYQVIIFTFIFLIPFILMAFAYSRISCILWSSTGPNYTIESLKEVGCCGRQKKKKSRIYKEENQDEMEMSKIKSKFLTVGFSSEKSRRFLFLNKKSERHFEEIEVRKKSSNQDTESGVRKKIKNFFRKSDKICQQIELEKADIKREEASKFHDCSSEVIKGAQKNEMDSSTMKKSETSKKICKLLNSKTSSNARSNSSNNSNKSNNKNFNQCNLSSSSNSHKSNVVNSNVCPHSSCKSNNNASNVTCNQTFNLNTTYNNNHSCNNHNNNKCDNNEKDKNNSFFQNSNIVSRRKVARMLICVVILFFICYVPILSYNILRYFPHIEKVLDSTAWFPPFTHWLCYFNSAVNPIIYGFMSRKFREAFMRVLTCTSDRRRHAGQVLTFKKLVIARNTNTPNVNKMG